MPIRIDVRGNQPIIYPSMTTTESNTFQKFESNPKNLRTFPIDDMSIKNELNEDPSIITYISANKKESVDSIKSKYIILTEKCIKKDYIII